MQGEEPCGPTDNLKMLSLDVEDLDYLLWGKRTWAKLWSYEQACVRKLQRVRYIFFKMKSLGCY